MLSLVWKRIAQLRNLSTIEINSMDDEQNATNSETPCKSDEANTGTCDQVRPKGGFRGLPCNWHRSMMRARYNSWYLCRIPEADETFEVLNFSTTS